MTLRAPDAAAQVGAVRRSGWPLVGALAVTQTIGYGVLYYAFAVLLVPVATELGTSTTVVTGAHTAAVLAGAALAVPVGRWLDRRGGRALMTGGSAVATLLVVAWANVQTVGQLYAVQVGLGLAGALVLYEPAFAVLVRRFDPARRPVALLAVTVVAGFASSIFLPLTGLLVAEYGWRHALLVLAAVHGASTVPLHALALRSPLGPPATAPLGPPATAPSGAFIAAPPSGRSGVVRTALRDRGFRLLVVGFTAQAAATAAFAIHLIAALAAWGHPVAVAATVAGLLGVLSVAGRVVTTGLQCRWPAARVVAAVFAVQAAAALALPLVGHHPVGALLAVAGFGIGFGVATIARPVLLAERLGTNHFGTLAGVLTVPVTAAKALGPLAAAALHGLAGGYPPVFVALGAACAVAAVTVALPARR